jgi:hypothetical protein
MPTLAQNLAIGLAVFAYILYRQLHTRPVKGRSMLPWILLALGAVQIAGTTGRHGSGNHVGAFNTDLLVIAAAMLIGAGFACARAYTLHIWIDKGIAYRKGNVWTALLWMLSIAVHFSLDAFVHTPGLAGTSLEAYFGLMLLIQREIAIRRAAKLQSAI